ncbi:hypothetical protein M758_8G163400 [Ceratodon purpureus]|nr:hypothetical protein M758_8G163400 [Ceratodon purpureus]
MASGLFMRNDSSNSRPFGGFVRSESSLSSKSSLGGSRRAIIGAMVLSSCVVILLQHAWYAHELVTGVSVEQFNSDPRTEETFEVVAPLSLLQEHLRSHDVGLEASSSELGLKDGSPTTETMGEVKDGVGIGEELEPVDSEEAAAANTTKSSNSKAGDVAEAEGTALNVPNKLVAEETGQKEEPEEVVTIRGNEVSAFATVELKQDFKNDTVVVERQEKEAVSNDVADPVDRKEGSSALEVEREEIEEVIPRAIPRTWEPTKNCATAEEMGAATVGNTRAASLRLRAVIQRWIVKHGAQRVRNLPAKKFCRERFVLGQALEDGFGNNMYKVLTAAGLAVMLDRSLIIAERLWMRPKWEVHPKKMPKPAFGDYLDFSNETFTVREVRKLWAIHGCEKNYNISLTVHTDTLDAGFCQTRCTCDDWTTLTVPVFEFKGATGAGAIQLLLKNAHPAMRAAAVKLLGNPAVPDSRPNTFGELFRAFIAPNGDIQAAVQWALKDGPDPDITLHLRMLHSKMLAGPEAAGSCINRIRQAISLKHPSRGRPRVVVVTDTPSIVPELKHALGEGVELVQFDYMEFAKGNIREDSILTLEHGLPAPERVKDWGEMPRWVAMVDFFLAARARTAVVSGAFRRVSTTYAQLVAALAAAYSLDERDPPHRPACVYYSSFQTPLVATGLKLQSGWGFSWRPFAGKLGCRNQPTQCAKTALQPYTWWDSPWQSPIKADIAILRTMTGLDSEGQVSEKAMDQYCAVAQKTELATQTLVIPSYELAIAAT